MKKQIKLAILALSMSSMMSTACATEASYIGPIVSAHVQECDSDADCCEKNPSLCDGDAPYVPIEVYYADLIEEHGPSSF